MVDKAIEGKTRSKWRFCAFYTESDPITSYMVSKLNLSPLDNVLEPCAGGGAFIDEILQNGRPFNSLEAVDLNPKSIKELKEKYSDIPIIFVRKTDTLFDRKFDDISAGKTEKYSKIIGNPPYGVWQGYKRRADLKKKYGGYVKDSYTLFLNKCISLLGKNGILTFIIPDTFMALNLHKSTRGNLIQNTAIEEILLIPSNYFPSVNFGYSNLCVITLSKRKAPRGHKIKILKISTGLEKISMLAKGDYGQVDQIEHISQSQIAKDPSFNIMIGGDERTRKLLRSGQLTMTIGGLCECVTGFYSGDNRKFLKPDSMSLKRTKGFTQVDPDEIFKEIPEQDKHADGINEKKRIYIPFLKGGSYHFFKPTEWYIKWDKKTVDFYKSDKGARFQNSKFYFKDGIGISMIKSKKLKAFDLDGRLFDQSVVGVFPKDPNLKEYILAYLNSKICSDFIQSINHTANNSSNYIKQIPIVINEKSISKVNLIMKNLNKNNTEKIISELDEHFESLFSLKVLS